MYLYYPHHYPITAPPHPNRPTTVLVSVMLANNETGIIMVRSQLISNSSHAVVCTKELQWNLSIADTTGTQLAVLYTVEPLYRGHH